MLRQEGLHVPQALEGKALAMLGLVIVRYLFQDSIISGNGFCELLPGFLVLGQVEKILPFTQ